MSHLTPFWLWETPGVYYGMPVGNLAGWFFTGILIMTALERLGASAWSTRLRPRATWAFYLANLLLPIGMSVAAGLWGAVALSFGALALGLLIWKIRRRPSARDTRAAFEPSLTSS
jgi:putative membrane protein